MGQLIFPSTHHQVKSLLEESDFEGSYDCWRAAREAINAYIGAGTNVLDVGCANGLLLASLQEWHHDVFIPYGFDLSLERILAARKLLPLFSAHFNVHNLWEFPWPVPRVHTVIAPWIESTRYIDTCLSYASLNVIFTAYNDKIASGVDMRGFCNRLGLHSYSFHQLKDMTELLVVDKAKFEGPTTSRRNY